MAKARGLVFAGMILGVGVLTLAPAEAVRVSLGESRSAVGQPADLSECEKLEWWTLDNINTERIIRGRPPLRAHPVLWTMARQHSEEMAEREFFGHFSVRGESLEVRLVRAGIVRWKLAAENLALSFDEVAPSLLTLHGWMMSPGHRQNILDPRFRETGIGVARSARGGYYFTQIFLDP
jgi:uncharacterized protein YkwD